jgi:hypothetical protein
MGTARATPLRSDSGSSGGPFAGLKRSRGGLPCPFFHSLTSLVDALNSITVSMASTSSPVMEDKAQPDKHEDRQFENVQIDLAHNLAGKPLPYTDHCLGARMRRC